MYVAHYITVCSDPDGASGSVRRACKNFGFRVADEGSEAVLYWSDCSVSIDRAAELKPYQVCEDVLIRRVQPFLLICGI